MGNDVLLSECDEGVMTLKLNRPERRNALDPALMRALLEALEDAAEDARVRCVVLRGAGRDFCTGGDVAAARDANEREHATPEDREAARLRAEKRGPKTPELMTGWLRRSMEAARLLHEMPKPTIAVLQGNIIGAGVGLACACDFRVVAENASLRTGFVRVGLSGDYGSSYFMTRLVGTAKARELFMLNEPLDAREMARLGLATRLVAPGELDAVTAGLARRLVASAPLALRYIKKNLNVAEDASLEHAFDVEAQSQSRCSISEDSKEALRALFEKRDPVYRGE